MKSAYKVFSIVLTVQGGIFLAVSAVILYLFFIIIFSDEDFGVSAYVWMSSATFFALFCSLITLLCGIFGLRSYNIRLCRVLSAILIAMQCAALIWIWLIRGSFSDTDGLLYEMIIMCACFTVPYCLYFFAATRMQKKPKKNGA